MTTGQKQRHRQEDTAWLTPSRGRWLAWSLAGLTFPMMVGTLCLVWLGRASPWRAAGEYSLAAMVVAVLSNAPAVLLGALLTARWPHNLYGWLWLGSGASLSLTQLAAAYAFHGLLIAPGTLPLAELAWSCTGAVWLLGLATAPFVLLLFPTGQLPSHHWRIVAWGVIGALLLGLPLSWAMAGLSGYVPAMATPESLPGSAGGVVDGGIILSITLLFLAILAGVVALWRRFQQAARRERQQLKWFTYGGVLVGGGLISDVFYTFPGVWESVKEAIVFNLLPPLTIGIAILRYRLYDIDLLIRRTLLYTVLTTCLALVYFGSVVGLQSLVPSFSGSAPPPLVTVLSTLATAALFTPFRRRIQAGIDRRFYRRQYDAEHILAAFRTTVRTETDLEHLCAALASVIQETMQPASLRLWLKPEQKRPAGSSLAGEETGVARVKFSKQIY